MEFLGLSIERAKKPNKETPSASFALPIDNEGASLVAAATNSAYYGVYLDSGGQVKDDYQNIQKCREIALYPEVDIAIQDIVNEAIPHETTTPLVTLNQDKLKLSDNLKEKINTEFEKVCSLLKYEEYASDIFRRWYIDGRLNYHIIVDKENLKRGILELRLIEATKIRKFKEVKKTKTPLGVDTIEDVTEYFVYNEQGFVPSQQAANTGAPSNTNMTGVRLSKDAIVYVPSGLVDGNTNSVISYLQKAIRPANQLRMLEDATMVYMVARAPERRVFYVDVGNLPRAKAEQFMKELMNKYRNKMVYDAKDGTVRDDKKHMSLLEDFWLPRRDGGKGTQIETLPGAQNLQGQIDTLEYYKKKLYEALNVPVSRLEPGNGFSMGRTQEISRDEVKFQKFIDKLRRKFSQLFMDCLKTQLTLKEMVNEDEWNTIVAPNIRIEYQRDNFFDEFKEQDMLTQRLGLLTQVDNYLQKYFSKQWVQKNILRMTDDDIVEMQKEMDEEKDDPNAQPAMLQQQQFQLQQPGFDGQQFGQDQGDQDQEQTQ